MMGYGMMGFGWIWMMIIPATFIGVIVYVAVKASNSSGRYEGKHHNSSQAIEILNQKFASGEISEEEYKRKKDLLRQ